LAGVVHRPIDTHPETHAPSSLARRSLAGLEAKTKKAFQGIALLAAIDRGAMAIDPRLGRESRHADDGSYRDSQIERPRY